MKNLIINFFIKRFLIDFIIGWIDKVLGALPGNEAKTLNAIAIAIISLILHELPKLNTYFGPVFEHLQGLPTAEVAAGSIGAAVIFFAHKLIKAIRDKFGTTPSTGQIKRNAASV